MALQNDLPLPLRVATNHDTERYVLSTRQELAKAELWSAAGGDRPQAAVAASGTDGGRGVAQPRCGGILGTHDAATGIVRLLDAKITRSTGNGNGFGTGVGA